ncbi:hypothetical protein [Haliscomenobacter sp.]|uniref:hypothetical protein n=1 Tax=Haliscomenobacter sp. TaxID=2717303 RepID=UPI00359429FB
MAFPFRFVKLSFNPLSTGFNSSQNAFEAEDSGLASSLENEVPSNKTKGKAIAARFIRVELGCFTIAAGLNTWV